MLIHVHLDHGYGLPNQALHFYLTLRHICQTCTSYMPGQARHRQTQGKTASNIDGCTFCIMSIASSAHCHLQAADCSYSLSYPHDMQKKRHGSTYTKNSRTTQSGLRASTPRCGRFSVKVEVESWEVARVHLDVPFLAPCQNLQDPSLSPLASHPHAAQVA